MRTIYLEEQVQEQYIKYHVSSEESCRSYRLHFYSDIAFGIRGHFRSTIVDNLCVYIAGITLEI